MTRNIVYGTPGSGLKAEPAHTVPTSQPGEAEPQTTPQEED